MGDYVTPTAQQPVQFWLDEVDNPDQWRLIVHSSAKNYHGSFEKFLDWIIPYVDARPGEFLGYVLNEDIADELRLIFYPPADRRYLTVVETSPGGEGGVVIDGEVETPPRELEAFLTEEERDAAAQASINRGEYH